MSVTMSIEKMKALMADAYAKGFLAGLSIEKMKALVADAYTKGFLAGLSIKADHGNDHSNDDVEANHSDDDNHKANYSDGDHKANGIDDRKANDSDEEIGVFNEEEKIPGEPDFLNPDKHFLPEDIPARDHYFSQLCEEEQKFFLDEELDQYQKCRHDFPIYNQNRIFEFEDEPSNEKVIVTNRMVTVRYKKNTKISVFSVSEHEPSIRNKPIRYTFRRDPGEQYFKMARICYN